MNTCGAAPSSAATNSSAIKPNTPPELHTSAPTASGHAVARHPDGAVVVSAETHPESGGWNILQPFPNGTESDAELQVDRDRKHAAAVADWKRRQHCGHRGVGVRLLAGGRGDGVSYAEFLACKQARVEKPGARSPAPTFTRCCTTGRTSWCAGRCRTGRAALWADTGMGKTVMQLEWARLSRIRTARSSWHRWLSASRPCASPLLGIGPQYVREWADVSPYDDHLYVTNYERLQGFPADAFDAVVLDESSILKAVDRRHPDHAHRLGQRRAAPAGIFSHAGAERPRRADQPGRVVGRMSRTHMLAAYFIHDQDGDWRLKGHARRPMMQWMAQWAVTAPPICHPTSVATTPATTFPDWRSSRDRDGRRAGRGQLFATDLGGVTGRAEMRRKTLTARIDHRQVSR